MRMRGSLLLASLLVAPAAIAQDPSAAVVKTFRAALADEVKDFRQAAADVVTGAGDDVAFFDAAIQTNQDPAEALGTLFEDLQVRLDELREHSNSSTSGAADALRDALAALDGESLPIDVAHGEGGAIDRFGQQVAALHDKAVARVRTRVQKALARARKATGLAFGVALVGGFAPRAFSADTVLPAFLQDESRIDLVLSLSDPGVGDDGRVWVSGHRWSADDVTVFLYYSGADGHDLEETVTTDLTTRRWDVLFEGVHEGVAVVFAVDAASTVELGAGTVSVR